ncbi:MAG: T9SS type A sorting domain-containing protein [Bacteroidia bacterium]
MKKIITLTLGCLIASSMLQAQTFSDDFESYTSGIKLGPQSPDWTTWSGVDGGTNDVGVVTTDNHTTAGSKSIYFSSVSSTGGPTDCVLPFGSSPINTGHFTYTMWMKIPTGKTAYFNFQGSATMGAMYTLDCFMDATGHVSIQNSGTEVLGTTHPFDTWFQLTIDVNLNANHWELLIDGVSQGTWSNANDQVKAIDIYPADASASYWVDDVSYNVVPYTLPSLNGAGNLVGVTNGLVGQSRSVAITVRNLGTTTINSFDLSVTQNAGAPVNQSVTGLTLASLASTVVNITTPFTLVAGPNTFTATVSNVNGLGADGDASDDVISTTITPVTPAAGKVVVAEEGTGTWCQWCPRGAVYMDAMSAKYQGYFAGIAVHNSDPMTVTAYDAAIGALISGYPSALVDRQPAIDPSGLEPQILSRVVIAPKGMVVNGATYNSVTRVLNVSVTTTLTQAITGNYKVACVITEDSVTGTSSSYNQANAYSGGASGVMGGFETLPNPVPASMMNYNHVARFLSPDFTGIPNAFGASAPVGTVATYNFSFTLPATYDANQVHIIGLFIDPTGKIDNAGSATIAQAVSNGYVTGAMVGINTIADAPDAEISIYPNPASDNSTISVNLKKESNVQVAIYAVDGSLVASKDYGKLSGGMLLPIEMSAFKAGMYFVNVTIDGKKAVEKLIKQ